MKRLILILSLMTSAAVTFSQATKFITKNEKFIATITDGAGNDVPINFRLADKLSDFKTNEVYRAYIKEYYQDGTMDAEFWKKNKGRDTFDIFLGSQTIFFGLDAKSKCKNSTSFTPVQGDGGMVYINPRKEIVMSMPIKAQNGYGNYIMMRAFYTIKIGSNGQIQRECFVLD